MPDLWLVSPAWRRLDVTRLVLAERRWLCDELDARGLTARGVIVADDENLEVAAEWGFDTVELPNDRGLGAKFNAGFKHALDNGADYVIHVGSDDWVHPDYFDGLPTTGSTVLTAGRITVVDLASSTGYVSAADRRWGVIPWAFPRAKLVDVAEPVEPSLMRGVELSLLTRLWPVDFTAHDPHAFTCVDFKTSENITSPASIARTHEPHPDIWEALAEHYPAHLVEQARALSD